MLHAVHVVHAKHLSYRFIVICSWQGPRDSDDAGRLCPLASSDRSFVPIIPKWEVLDHGSKVPP